MIPLSIIDSFVYINLDYLLWDSLPSRDLLDTSAPCPEQDGCLVYGKASALLCALHAIWFTMSYFVHICCAHGILLVLNLYAVMLENGSTRIEENEAPISPFQVLLPSFNTSLITSASSYTLSTAHP